jgi:hypothetical protein
LVEEPGIIASAGNRDLRPRSRLPGPGAREDHLMDPRRFLWMIVVVLALWQGWQQWTLRPVQPRDGPIAPDEPVQSEPADGRVVPVGNWTLTPRAHYSITARILGREDYRFDALADVAPEDLALGWGRMSDNRVLAGFEVSQGARVYSWRTRGEAWPIPREEVVEHSANTHVIPADPAVRRRLDALRVGEVVHLEGELVDGQRADGMTLRTSLTRTDSGPGACEVLLVREVNVR